MAAESAALGRLYERHSEQVFRFCLGYLRKRDEAEDAAQTTFLHALRALRRGVVPTSESAWLLTIARNVCLNRFDYARRRGNLELVQDPRVLAEMTPARTLEEVDLHELQAALKRLPARQRQAILLREWQGLSYAEIGEELGLSTSAVETLIFRARRALARELGGEESRRGIDLAGLLGWLKALVGGGAAKVAVGAAVVATVGVVAPVAVEGSGGARTPVLAARPVAAAHVPVARAALAAAPVTKRTPGSRRPFRGTAPAAAPLNVAAAVAPRALPAPERAPAEPGPAPAAAPPQRHAVPAPPVAAAPAASSTESSPVAPALPVSAPSLPDPSVAVATSVQAPPLPELPQAPPLPPVSLPAPPPPPIQAPLLP